MTAYKIALQLDGREVEMTVLDGVLATAEFGKLDNGEPVPEHRITLIAKGKSAGPVAWAQVTRFEGEKRHIEAEGWIGSVAEKSIVGSRGVSGTISSIADLTSGHAKCLEGSEFGILSCCRADGSGCYVSCCGSCCADPARCPGASCCP